MYQQLEWATNETLRLERMAHEAFGAGSWVGAAEVVPVTTEKGERLGMLDVADETHPRLAHNGSEAKWGMDRV